MGYIADIRIKVGKDPVFMPGGGIFFIDGQGRALLQKRADNGLWAGTGGALDLGETFEEAARREAFEELRLVPGKMTLLNMYSGETQHYTYPNGDEVYVIAAVYICEDYAGNLTIDPEECLDARFFSLDELPSDEALHPPDRPMIKDLREWMRQKLAKPCIDE